MMREMMAPPPLPPKTRGNSCSATGAAGATVFVRPAGIPVHSSASNTSVSSSRETVGHVVKIKINPEYNEAVKPNVSSVQLSCKPEIGDAETSVVRISVGENRAPPEEMLQSRTSAYFFCSAVGGVSSGQCSPSDTLDSGTCSDLDGTPPPLPKKKGVTVTVIGAQHKRASSLTSSGADADSASSGASDNESNISCDSLNSADLNNELQPATTPPSPPSMLGLKKSTPASSGSAFLPQGLLKDIRNRSAKLSQPQPQSVASDTEPADEVVPEEEEENESVSSPSRSPVLVTETTYEERQRAIEREQEERRAAAIRACDEGRVYTYETDKYYKFHLNEHLPDPDDDTTPLPLLGHGEDDESFAGYRDFLGGNGSSTIRSAKGTVRGVKNRVRAGIATFLQINQTSKSYREKDAGKVVVYTTTMGIVRHTYQQCVKVKQILRTHLVKFEERDVFMSGECQAEIRERMRCEHILVPQVFVDGQHIGDAETIERLNESGELRRILKPYKSPDACTTCAKCGGYRLLPCPVCNGSKKSVHRNHFTTEFVALKCMNCDEVGLVRCSSCS